MFLTVDPIVVSTQQPYDYAGQDPINGYDPTGTVNEGEVGEQIGGAYNPPDPVEDTPGEHSRGAIGRTLVLGTRNDVDEFRNERGYETLNLPSRGSGRWWWSRNKTFIDNAIKEERPIMLVTDPNKIRYSGGNTLAREVRYLEDRGFTFQKDSTGRPWWYAIRNR